MAVMASTGPRVAGPKGSWAFQPMVHRPKVNLSSRVGVGAMVRAPVILDCSLSLQTYAVRGRLSTLRGPVTGEPFVCFHGRLRATSPTQGLTREWDVDDLPSTTSRSLSAGRGSRVDATRRHNLS